MVPDLAGRVGSPSSRLIVIRGSSGSGKSSVAAAIRASRPDRTVAVVGQDVMRREVLGTGDDVDGHATALIDLTTRFALARGFDVVLEGILNADWYRETLLRLMDDHRGASRCYLYDLSFEETVRRHATKPVSDSFGVAELRKWWRGCQRVEGLDEAIVTDTETLDSTVARVISDCWKAC
jgi:predicted kinase